MDGPPVDPLLGDAFQLVRDGVGLYADAKRIAGMVWGGGASGALGALGAVGALGRIIFPVDAMFIFRLLRQAIAHIEYYTHMSMFEIPCKILRSLVLAEG